MLSCLFDLRPQKGLHFCHKYQHGLKMVIQLVFSTFCWDVILSLFNRFITCKTCLYVLVGMYVMDKIILHLGLQGYFWCYNNNIFSQFSGFVSLSK